MKVKSPGKNERHFIVRREKEHRLLEVSQASAARSYDKSRVKVKAEFLLHNTVYKNSVRTSQETHYVSTTKPNRLMLFRERVAVYYESHTKHINILRGAECRVFLC
jgi:hypothetical protein